MFDFTLHAPESQGVRSSDIIEFIRRLCMNKPGQEPHGLILMRHGKMIAEGYFKPFGQEYRHTLFSVTKSLVSTAIGFAVQEQLVSVDDKISDYFPESLPDLLDPGFEKLKVRHVLMMSTGLDDSHVPMGIEGMAAGYDVPAAFFRTKFLDEPGQTFRYQGIATHMLVLLLKKVSGCGLIDYLMPRLFEPLGIPRPDALCVPDGAELGYSGCRLSLRELALYAQFYLQEGMWEGRQLLNAEWIRMASAKHVGTDTVVHGPDWQSGYCFQFWRGTHNTYRFCGAYGQMNIVMPDLDMVCLFQSGYTTDVLQYVVDSFYDTVAAGVQDAAYDPDPAAELVLRKTCENLTLTHVFGDISPLAAHLNGYDCQGTGDFTRCTLQFAAGNCVLTLYDLHGRVYTVAAGLARPVLAPSTLADRWAAEPSAYNQAEATACFVNLNTLRISIRVVPTPTLITLDLGWTTDGLKLEMTSLRGRCDGGLSFTETK